MDVRVISPKRIQESAQRIGDADLANDLSDWLQVVKSVHWRNFMELRQSFATADHVDGLVVFDIRHNRFRLITRVIYSQYYEPDQRWTPGQLLIGAVYTHVEYDRWNLLTATQKKERIWPRS
jgi:mRNA interferase HigB